MSGSLPCFSHISASHNLGPLRITLLIFLCRSINTLMPSNLMTLTVGYALFQTANNTAVMTDIRPDQRGVISGILNLSRNLGLITGASVMGAVFAFGSATIDITTAHPEAVATGMRMTFAIAAILVVTALAIADGSRGFQIVRLVKR